MSNNTRLNRETIRILIIKPSSLGDIFHTFPAVGLLLEKYPEAKIDWLVAPGFAEALEFCPNLNQKIIFPRRKLGKLSTFLPAFFRLRKALKQNKYDLVVDFQGLFRSAFFGSMARTNRYVGFAVPREKAAAIFYKEKAPIPKNCIHAVDRYLALAAFATGKNYVPSDYKPLAIVNEAEKRASALLDECGIKSDTPFIGVLHDARWESKCWPEQFFIDTLKELFKHRSDLKAVVLGAPSCMESANTIASAFESTGQVFNLAGKTSIIELAEVLRKSRGIIANDSGPMHIAVAVGVPVFGLFGPTNPERTGPHGNNHLILRPDLPCLNCLKRICPNGIPSKCHGGIDPVKAAAEILNRI